MFSGLEEVESERKRETSSTVENKEPFFLYAWRRKNACSFKTRESEFPLLIRFAYLQHREEICLPFTMLSYKGDTLGEHMHAWPQDLTRAEGEGGRGYRLHRQQNEPIASRLDRYYHDPTMASNGCLILNRCR